MLDLKKVQILISAKQKIIVTLRNLIGDIVTTCPSLLKCITLKPRPLIASQFELV